MITKKRLIHENGYRSNGICIKSTKVVILLSTGPDMFNCQQTLRRQFSNYHTFNMT